MSVTNVYSPQSFTGDGATTTFPFPFEFQAASDLVVKVTDLSNNTTTKVLNVDYTVTGVGLYAGGSVVFTVAPTAGFAIVVSRATSPTQPTSFVTQGFFLPASVEAGMDRDTLVNQEQAISIATIQGKQTTDEAAIASLQTTVNAMSGGTYIPNLVPFSQMLIPGGRLTLLSGTPVPSADQTGATSIIYTPHKHTLVPLYNGTSWNYFTFSEVSQALSDATKSPAAAVASTCYDMYVWSDGGTIRCTRGFPWASDTSRGTGAGTAQQTLQDGRLVNAVSITNGPPAKQGLYVGTIRTDGSANANDSKAKRHVWNMHNRAVRQMAALETTASWSYSGGLRQANGNAANQLDVVRGLDEDAVNASITHVYFCNNLAANASSGIGLDSTTALAPGSTSGNTGSTVITSNTGTIYGSYSGMPGLGRHFLAWIENSSTSSTTFYGISGAIQTGITGTCMA